MEYGQSEMCHQAVQDVWFFEKLVLQIDSSDPLFFIIVSSFKARIKEIFKINYLTAVLMQAASQYCVS